MTVESGALYWVATPIGNLEDISARALRVFREANCIAAEDTRHTGQLLPPFRYPDAAAVVARTQRTGPAGVHRRPIAGGPIAGAGVGRRHAVDQRSRLSAGARTAPAGVEGHPGARAKQPPGGAIRRRFADQPFRVRGIPARQGRRPSGTLAGAGRGGAYFSISRSQPSHRGNAGRPGGDVRRRKARGHRPRIDQAVRGSSRRASGGTGGLAGRQPQPPTRRIRAGVEAAPAASEVDTPETRRILAALLGELPASRAVAVAARLTGLRKKPLYELALTLGGRRDSEGI